MCFERELKKEEDKDL